MSSNPPVRQSWEDAPTEIDTEVREQIESRKKRKAEERKVQRPKATYDLPLELIEAVNEISDAESVPRSDIAAWALVELVERYQAGQVEWAERKYPARSLRYRWKLELPGEW